MLNAIREKLKGWIIFVLVILIAIPLIFLGVGDFGTNQKSYSMVVNDQSISIPRLEQEVFRYRKILEKNYQGNIPDIYTNKFIKKLTLDYLLRSLLMNHHATELNLVYSPKSIISEIKNTDAFKTEVGFDLDLYKRQLFTLGMSSKEYENYLYRTGISNQLKSAITDTSFLTKTETTDLKKFRGHIRKGEYVLLKYDDVRKNIIINDNEITAYYNKNKNSFMSEKKGIFRYLDIDKNNIINKIAINDEIIKDIYTANLANGVYNEPEKYKINHILFKFDKNKDRDNIKEQAIKARKSLNNNNSFSVVSKKYSNDQETINNKGYLGEFFIDEIPSYLQTHINTLKIKEISQIIESDKGYHLISILDKSESYDKKLNEVRNIIIKDYKEEHGTRLYYDLSEKIKEDVFVGDKSIEDLSIEWNIPIIKSKLISENEGYSIFNYEFIRNILFSDKIVNTNKLSDPIYVNDDRFLVAVMDKYYKPEQLKINDARDAIQALLVALKTSDKINKNSNNLLIELNNNNSETLYKVTPFEVSIDTNSFNQEYKEIIFSSNLNKSFSKFNLKNKDVLLVSIKSINYPDKMNAKLDDSFSNFIINTRSESEFNWYYQNLKQNAEIIYNDDYLSRN
ncbi:MAG: hypothetical protein CMD65_00325 [Gammaproteobacteria bacterium]|nr:hypothetical protein [Gammaproteobacteria bacterium]|tara:strand:- start:316 stop:2187 length:1872 start_codon:yes stop_codon:yes gene_type:complete